MEINSSPPISKWSATIHIVGFSIFTVSMIGFTIFKELEFNPTVLLLIIMPIALAVNFLWLFISREDLDNKKTFYVFTAINLSIITAIIHFSGGQNSPFPFLFLVSIISATLISFRATLVISIVAVILFLALIFIEPPIGIAITTLIRFLRLILLGTIVVFQAHYLVSRIRLMDNELLNLKDQFIFRTVHDIRSPVVSIRWLLDKYKRPEFKEKYVEIQDDIKRVEGAASRIMGISEHLLNLAKGKKETINLEPIDLTVVIKDILTEMNHGISEKNLKVEYDISDKLSPALGNFELLQEVFANIIGNGIKYNSMNGKLSIWHTIEGKNIKTSILNTGPKISSETMHKLFTPYFRGDMERRITGTGLGLYITKEIVERLGGKVGVELSTDESTIFYVTLPIANN